MLFRCIISFSKVTTTKIFKFLASVSQQKEVPFSNSNLRPRIDPITNIRIGGGTGFGLPPPAKFRSGHLPSNAIPVSTAILGDVDESESNSDNDMSTGSEEEVYEGRYSQESSPQDERIPNGTTAHRYGNPEQRPPHYASDYMYSDVSSSMETVVGRQGHVAERLMRGNGRYPVGKGGYTEDESSDSAASSEFSTTQVGSINGAVPHSRAYVSEGYASSVPSRVNVESATRKVCNKASVLFSLFLCDWFQLLDQFYFSFALDYTLHVDFA